MATVRIATNEVQVDDTIYTFQTPHDADAFEACVATVDLTHCIRDHPAIGSRLIAREEGDPDPSQNQVPLP
jgi:hypothetical protein